MNTPVATRWPSLLGWGAVAALGAAAVGMLAWVRGEPVSALWMVVAALCTFALAYRFHSAWLMARVLTVDESRATPAVVRGGPGFWQFGITSTFTLPFIDYGVRAANHRAARAQIASADANYRNALAAVEADVRSAARDAQATAEKLELAKQSERLARESARIAQLQYKNGVISFNDAASIQQTALSAENDLIAARANYVIAVVRLRLSLGPTDPAAATDVRT